MAPGPPAALKRRSGFPHPRPAASFQFPPPYPGSAARAVFSLALQLRPGLPQPRGVKRASALQASPGPSVLALQCRAQCVEQTRRTGVGCDVVDRDHVPVLVGQRNPPVLILFVGAWLVLNPVLAHAIHEGDT